MILFKKQLFDLEDKGQGPMKVIMVCDTPPNGHAPTYQLSLTYLERKNVMAWTSKYYLKNNYLPLRSKVIAVRDTLPYSHAPTYQISLTYLERQKSYGLDKHRWEEAEEEEEVEAEEKIRLKQYVSLRSKGRHNYILY